MSKPFQNISAKNIQLPAKIILAAASPRRKELLSKIARSCEILPSNAPEIEPPECHWSETALLNAVVKAQAVAALHPEALVIGADTVIEFDGRILGKPRDLEDAKAMLQTLSGATHEVATGVCLASVKGEILCRFIERTKVEFKKLDKQTIEEYLSKVHVLDKAGAYAIQDHGDLIVEGIEGDLDNVVGLPATRLAEAISAAGCGGLLRPCC